MDADGAAAADELFSQLRSAMGSGGGGGGRRSFAGGGGVRRVGAAAGAVLAVAAVAVGLSWLRPVSTAGAPRPRPAPARATAGTVEAPVSAEETTTAPAGRVWPPEDPVVVDGTEVGRGDERWSVGDEGDLVAVGDWDCDGSPTPAVLRPSVGQVFVFSSWADAATAVPGPVAPTDAVTFSAKGCGKGEVQTSSGAVVEIETVEGR